MFYFSTTYFRRQLRKFSVITVGRNQRYKSKLTLRTPGPDGIMSMLPYGGVHKAFQFFWSTLFNVFNEITVPTVVPKNRQI